MSLLHSRGLAVLRTGRPPRTVVGTAQLAATGAYQRALSHVDGLLGRIEALGSMSWSVTQWTNLMAYKNQRDEFDRGYTMAVQQGNESLAESAANAQESLAELIERDYFDSTGTPKKSDVKTGMALAQEIKDKIPNPADVFSIPWWLWAVGGVAVLGGAGFFLWPLLVARGRR